MWFHVGSAARRARLAGARAQPNFGGMAQNKCGYGPCGCEVATGQKFCSDGCRDLAGMSSQSSMRCGCDHSSCAHEAKKS
jgi:hypothetical protein